MSGQVRSEKEGPFTRYLRVVMADGPVEIEMLTEMWTWLLGVLRGELRYRLLGQHNPSRVGILGYSSWTQRGSSTGKVGDALEDLAMEAYVYLFDKKFRTLREALKDFDEAKKRSGDPGYRDIDGKVRIYLRNFIYERQRDHDPIGYRAYEVVKKELRMLVSDGELAVTSGGEKIRNDTEFSFLVSRGAEGLATLEDLAEGTRPWAGRVLLQVVLAHARGTQKPREELRRRLLDLRHLGVVAFRFGDLLNPMKGELRSLLSTLFESEQPSVESGGSRPGTAWFAMSLESREHFRKLVDCIEKAVQGSPPGARRDRLQRLWDFFRLFARTDLEEEMPAAIQLAEALDIPRNSIPDLRATLGGMYKACQQGLSGLAAEGVQGSLERIAVGGQGHA